MLRYLHLKNLVLIESSKIEFHSGLHILSGETGAGKTALIEAIGLALGQRADSSAIRKGEEKAIVEAGFSISCLPKAQALLEEAGIDFDKDEILVIRREITKEGKNRALINHQAVPLPLLQSLSAHLIDLIGQHSAHLLRSSDSHRTLLDLFAGLDKEIDAFQSSWQIEKQNKQELEALLKEQSLKEKEEEKIQSDLEELSKENFSEEELLFEEYGRLQHSQELQEKMSQVCQLLSESPASALPLLHRAKNALDPLLSIDPTLKESQDLLQEAFVNLKESSHLLCSYLHHLENNPSRLQYLEERLSQISRLKRKYGPALEDIERQKLTLATTLDKWRSLDLEIEKAQEALKYSEHKTKSLCEEITKKRMLSAKKLSAHLTASLQSLNMAGAELSIDVTPDKRSSSGEDAINFFLKANKGESFAPVKANASGGELCRLLFSLKTTLAEKNQTPTLIFDEIDANVGGETAAIMGEKLQELGQHAQVLCITHFPQVACKAEHHYRIYKEQEEGRTFSRIVSLDDKERQKELLRMLGGKKEALFQEST